MDGDDLYGLPLSDFTKARDELAKRLRTEGKREEADAVKSLRKPTAAAWALNQIARKRPKDVQRLVSTGEQLRKAHEALFAGGNRSAVQKASAKERELIDELTRDATAVAGEAGTASTAALDERIRNTLHAAALDEETATELKAGRLEREREAVGSFGSDAATAQPPARKPPAKGPAKADKQAAARRRDLERAVKAARSDEQRARKAVAAAQRRGDVARTRCARPNVRSGRRLDSLERATRAVAAAEKKLG